MLALAVGAIGLDDGTADNVADGLRADIKNFSTRLAVQHVT